MYICICIYITESLSYTLLYLAILSYTPKHNTINQLCCSVAKLCPTLCSPMDCSMPGSSVLHYLPEFAQFISTESVMPFSHFILCHSLFLLPSIFPSIRAFSRVSSSQQVARVLELQLQHQSFQGIFGFDFF